jgi:hypothetical protein
MSDKLEALKAALPQSEQGNFYIKDSIGVPHPYMITSKHVVYASDHHSGMLGEAAIKGAERNGHYCGICKGKLKYEQHEQAVVIGCKIDTQDPDDATKGHPELHAYLLALKPLIEADKYFVGFAFLDERPK